MSLYCTAPWNDVFLQWDRIAPCCELAFNGSQYEFESWEAWDDLEGTIENAKELGFIRDKMRCGEMDSICNKFTRCSCRKQVEGTETSLDSISKPRIITIAATSTCQAQCHYCGQWRPQNKLKKPEPTKDQIKNLVNSIKNIGFTYVCYTGGDLLSLDDEKLDLYLTPLSDVGRLVITNGIGLTKERWDKYFTNKNISLHITIDTMDPLIYAKTRGKNGAFTIHDRLRRILKGQDVSRVTLQATITASNLECIKDIIVFASELGITSVGTNAVSPNTSCIAKGQNISSGDVPVETLIRAKSLPKEWKVLAKELNVDLEILDRYIKTVGTI
jgi:sulfatase maturation enzyme AslB (radical SAM superfamily)